MAISPTTKKVIVEGGRIPNHPGLVRRLMFTISGSISSITSTLASVTVQGGAI